MKDLAALPLRPRRPVARPPRPLLAALPFALLALLVFGIGFADAIGLPWLLAVAGSVVFVGLLRAVRAAVELGRRRREADEWLLRRSARRPPSAPIDWRTHELDSPRLHSMLASSLRRVELEARGSTVPGPVPLNTPAIRAQLGLVHALQERLEDHSRPMSIRGVLLVDRLLTEPGSPLYSRVSADVLAQAIREALAAIDPASPSVTA